jgi:hypothetical protein
LLPPSSAAASASSTAASVVASLARWTAYLHGFEIGRGNAFLLSQHNGVVRNDHRKYRWPHVLSAKER